MAKTKVFYKLPNGVYIKKEITTPTTYTQNKRTGRMTGRRVVKNGKGDGTKVNRIKRDFILVKKSKTRRGHTRTIRKRYLDGQLSGLS